MPYQVHKGDTAYVRNGTFGWSSDHYNGKKVLVLEGGSGNSVVSVRCDCCGDEVNVSVSDLS